MSVAALILQHFKGNPKYVAYAEDGKSFRPVELKEPLTPERLAGHLSGKHCLGFYLLSENKVSVSCVDFDAHNGDDDGLAIMNAKTVARFLIDQGFDPLIEVSQSGYGCHVWLKHDPPCEAFAVREFWLGVLQQTQLKCEIYPRQSGTEDLGKGLGNLIRYPLFNKSHFISIDGIKAEPEAALTDWESISAYNVRVKGELWHTAEHASTRSSKFETEGLPKSVADLIESEELLQRRWAGDVAGMGDQSKSAVVMAIAVELVRRYVPTPEIIAALKFWCDKEQYEKADARWLELTAAKAYSFMKGGTSAVKGASKGSLAAASHRHIDRVASGHDLVVQTGIQKVDESIGGMGFGEVVCIACRPSNGKSAQIIQMLESTARQGYESALISLEMSESEVAGRTHARLGLTPEHFEKDLEKSHKAVDAYYSRLAPIHVLCDAYKINEIEQAITYYAGIGVRVFAVDHIGKISGENTEGEYSLLSNAWNTFSRVAKSLNVIIIVAAQRNRKADDHGDDVYPKLSSIHGSSHAEQASDTIIIGRHLWKEEPLEANRDRYVCHLMKARNRRIREPIVECTYNTDTQTFT